MLAASIGRDEFGLTHLEQQRSPAVVSVIPVNRNRYAAAAPPLGLKPQQVTIL